MERFGSRIVTERQREVAARAATMSLRNAASQLGITPARVREIAEMVKHRATDAVAVADEERLPVELRRIKVTGLSTRARSVLVRAGFRTCGDVMTATASQILALPNAGNKVLSDIEDYLGRKLPKGTAA